MRCAAASDWQPWGCVFLAFQNMELADAKAILFSAPLFMTVLSIPILGERVGIYRWSAVLIGFVGVLVILRPDDGDAANRRAFRAGRGPSSTRWP